MALVNAFKTATKRLPASLSCGRVVFSLTPQRLQTLPLQSQPGWSRSSYVQFSTNAEHPLVYRRRFIDKDRIILLGLGVGFIAVFMYWNSSKDKPRKKNRLAKRLHRTVISAQAAVNLNDYEEATKKYKEAIEILKATEEETGEGPVHNSIAFRILDQLANLSYELQKWSEAEDLFKETLQRMLLAGQRKDDDAVIEVSLKLAKTFHARNKSKLASEGFKFCISMMDGKINEMDDIPCDSLTLLGLCLTEYGTFCKEVGQLDESEKAFSRALTIAKQVLGPKHEQTCVITNDLATVYDELGKYNKAENLVKKSIRIAEETSPENLAAYQYNLGAILIHKGELGPARKALGKALDIAMENEDQDTMELVTNSMMKLDVDTS